MSDYALEIELKYAATPAALAVLADAERLGPALLGPTVVNDESDRYLDTPDRRLSAAGWACRLRTRRVDGIARTFVSLKGPAEPAVAEMHRRPEIEAEAPDDLDPARWPPSPARELVDRLRDGAAARGVRRPRTAAVRASGHRRRTAHRDALTRRRHRHARCPAAGPVRRGGASSSAISATTIGSTRSHGTSPPFPACAPTGAPSSKHALELLIDAMPRCRAEPRDRRRASCWRRREAGDVHVRRLGRRAVGRAVPARPPPVRLGATAGLVVLPWRGAARFRARRSTCRSCSSCRRSRSRPSRPEHGLAARALASIVAFAAMLPVSLVAIRARPQWVAFVAIGRSWPTRPRPWR